MAVLINMPGRAILGTNNLFPIIISNSFLSDVSLPYNMPPSTSEQLFFEMTSTTKSDFEKYLNI